MEIMQNKLFWLVDSSEPINESDKVKILCIDDKNSMMYIPLNYDFGPFNIS